MTVSKTATVETLTAEVRVLMVGSRQVTLSVYGQLDTAEYEDMELFGRVSPRGAQSGYIYFIGRQRENGSLVRGSLPAIQDAVKAESWDIWGNIEDRCERHERLSAGIKRHCEGNHYHRCGKEDHSQCDIYVSEHRDDPFVKRPMADVEARIKHLGEEIAELQRIGYREITEALALADRVAALPLIVLAGLR